MWRWLSKRVAKMLPPDEPEHGIDAQSARAMREAAEEALRQERTRERDTKDVATISRKLRTQNNFSARITESFQGKA